MDRLIARSGWPALAFAMLALVIGLADLVLGDGGFFAAGVLGGISRGILAVLAVWALLSAWDRANGLCWRAAYGALAAAPMAQAVYHAGRLIAVCLLFGLVLGCTPAVAGPASGLSDPRFDAAIARAAVRYLPTGPDWRRYKAQLWQESRLDPRAVSPVGARGIAQFMPATWADMIRDLRLVATASPHDARLAIEAGAYYRGRLERGWHGPVRAGQRRLIDRHRLAEASYNAGMGNILAAQRRCGDAIAYAAIIACLPAVTGHHHRETWDYVARIGRWTAQLRQAGGW